MSDRPALYLCVRPEAAAASAEYASFRRGMDRDESALHVHDLVSTPLPDDVFDRYAGFVVGGSPFNLSDPVASKSETQLRVEADLERLAREALEERTRLLLTCYGIGIATRLLGGSVTTDFPEEASAAFVTTTADAESDVITADLSSVFRALSAHKEGAGVVPPGAVLLATNDACPVQMFRAGSHLYATQFHPEPTPQDFTWRMAAYRDAGYFDPADYDRLAGAVEAADVTEPTKILRRFSALIG